MPDSGPATGGWPAGVGLILLDEVDSTLDEARRRTVAAPCWIVARRQTAARGRRGRPWRMPEGNFAGTLILDVPEGQGAMARRSLVAALALHDALVEVAGPGDYALKWPNDVLLGGAKLAGILLEPLTPTRLAIGIGVNLAAAPDPGEVEPDALRPVALSAPAEFETFAAALARAFAAREAKLAKDGPGAIHDAWLARAARRGETIRARVGPDTLHGTFEGLDPEGHLILATATGRRHLPAAEIDLTPCS